MKTPEELAEEHAQAYIESDSYLCSKYSFLAGYKAAQEQYKEAIETYEDVAKQMLHEAIRIMEPTDRLADGSKVMDVSTSATLNNWISVKDRLPEEDVTVLAFINYSVDDAKLERIGSAAYRGKLWLMGSDIYSERFVTHWMPLPEPPKHDNVK